MMGLNTHYFFAKIESLVSNIDLVYNNVALSEIAEEYNKIK
ncbi:hypothetical protein [Tissierella sp. Yu-01]|jgi:pseudouridine-5'-phosphate glycosidase|nr:hypothetical protein [Tissierella sp. Yu-01]WFA09185.1 hypothetical protein P3962_01030 [Tissierella sp. Yu-01]